MFIISLIVCIDLLLSTHFSFNKDYLSKSNTQVVKGIFVVCVFLSHIRTYVNFTNSTDLLIISFLDFLGQLMVTFFLFMSGYGIYEAIKNKGNDYLNDFPKNRIAKTFFDFALAVTLFLILSIVIGKHYSISRILLSYIGWTSIGNSSWYMFVIFVLYLLTYVCFKLLKNYPDILKIILMTVLSLVYIYLMSKIQPSRYSNTFLCYVFGMWYSYFKESIDSIIQNQRYLYYFILALIFVMFIYVYPMRNVRLMYYNLTSVVFCLMLVFLMMLFSFKSKLLSILGDYLFWIYILQRIPMILINSLHVELNCYLYLLLCIFFTGLLSYIINIISQKLKKIIFR